MLELATKKDFDDCLSKAGEKLVVIDFHAQWCGPCKRVAPEYEALSKEFPQATFVKVDVDGNQETAQACRIKAMPTFQLYKKAALVKAIQGADIGALRQAVQENSGDKWSTLTHGHTLAKGDDPTASAAAATAALTVRAPAEVTVDESKPCTTIQIKLHNNTRLTQRFNLSHSVQDLYAFVASATPGAEFTLATTYPRATLSDMPASLADAKLDNAAIQQNLK
eukprot:CAMPEP_0181317860 /NCGR_PEP_ID=MMETSP1101-20121128/16695_1 /TAXON_ID=46948 /ORGANISM="Rhodomonas abbreviata, Strain Caron Lab Isolate" /LENGTH=222 /DNA_ID=CAMNT_0023425285 /DNA_START=33 /DNA_END=704 /DNA_ORIENTATION=+